MLRHQDGGVEATGSLADSNFGAFAADGLSTLSNQRYSSPSAAGAAFVADRIRFPGNFYAPLDSTCQPHPFTTPPGVSWAGSWTVPPSRPTVATAYRAVYLARPDGHFTAKVPSSHSPQGCLACGPGQPTYLTVCWPRKLYTYNQYFPHPTPPPQLASSICVWLSYICHLSHWLSYVHNNGQYSCNLDYCGCCGRGGSSCGYNNICLWASDYYTLIALQDLT